MTKISMVLLFSLSLINIPMFGEVMKIKKEVKNFDSISLMYPGIVHLKQGDTESLTIEADDAVIEKIDININGSTLVVRSNKRWWENFSWFIADSGNEVNFYITMKDVQKILASSSNTINIETPINIENLVIKISGNGTLKSMENIIVNNKLSIHCSGHMELELKKLVASLLNIDTSGSSDIKILTGNVNKQEIEISGSGKYIAPELKTKETDITCRGSGKLEVNATDALKVNISGSGKVIYSGDPKKLEQKISGSGTIQRASK